MKKITPLKNNDLKGEAPKNHFESHPAHSKNCENGLIVRPFRFLENYSDPNSDQELVQLKYKKPVLRKGTRWWIEYWYAIPPELKHLHDGKKWKKYRVFEDINRYKTDDYAQLLLRAVRAQLKGGFDPFKWEKEILGEIRRKSTKYRAWTITQGLSYFLQAWQDRGNEPHTHRVYKTAIDTLTAWLNARKLQNRPMADLRSEWVEECLKEATKANDWSNRTYNNNLNLLRTAFNYLVKKEMINRSPGAGVDRKKTKSEKHRYYDPEKFTLIRKVMQEQDPVVFLAAKLVYYLCIRSNKELRNFRVGDIYLDRRQVLVHAEISKTDTARYIGIPDDLYWEMAELKQSYPDDYYVIGAWHQGNTMLKENRPGPKPFGKNFLVKRFGIIRKAAGLDSRYTIYSFKHSRIIHLKQDGAKDHDIMGLTGHESFEAYAAYLRDLGISGDAQAINSKTRKF